MKRRGLAGALVGLVLLGVPVTSTVAADRSAVPEKYTWNLADLYPSPAAWAQAKEAVAADIPKLAARQGTLGASAANLKAALDAIMDVSQRYERLAVYASMLQDQDTRIAENQARMQEADQLGVKLREATSWFRPELLAVGRERVEGFLASEKGLAIYRPYLDDILRAAPHTLSPQEEKLVASASAMAEGPGEAYGIFTNADLPFPEVTLSTGETVRLDNAGYTRWRAAASREDRLKVFDAFWKTYQSFNRTLGTTLNAHVRTHLFNRDARKFGTSLEAALFPGNIPTQVYTQLIADVHANLPTLHRYLDLRRRLMGLDALAYQDLYAPIVKKVDMTFTPEQSIDLTLKAVRPLGPDYVEALRKGFDSRWVDFMPSTGKRSGAYSTGAYGVHPYQLQNFMGKYEDVSTVAHEAGHSMHTYLSMKSQPYVTADYAIFVAEVASTLNENLLLHTMLAEAKDDDTRLFLLGSYLDNLRGTLFRQTLFAEFELRMHEMAEKGEPLTGESLNALYLGLVRTYYGHDKGVVTVDELIAPEWSYIHHFYYNFYVYQYATSLVASISLAQGIREEAAAQPPSTKARDAYLAMLSSGSSKYPIDLLKGAGVDMTTSAPFRAAMKEMNRIMDEMETILARRK